MYTLSPRACGPLALGVHIRQNTCAHVTTVNCVFITFLVKLRIFIVYVYDHCVKVAVVTVDIEDKILA